MSQGSNWPVRLWVALLAMAVMFGAASLGVWAWDHVERRRGPVVTNQSGELQVPQQVVENHHGLGADRIGTLGALDRLRMLAVFGFARVRSVRLSDKSIDVLLLLAAGFAFALTLSGIIGWALVDG